MAEEKEQVSAEEEAPEVSVRDRRRVTAEGEVRDAEESGEPESTPEEAAEVPSEEGTEEPSEEPSEPRLPTLNDFFRIMLMELRTRAWPYLVRSVESGTFSAEDQTQIRFARDLFSSLLERLQAAPDLSAEEKEELKHWEAAEQEGGGFYDVARLMLMELHARAWQSLGLMPHPLTNLITTDLAQARQAIDAFTEVLNQLEESKALSEAEIREFRRLKSDLQTNYVQRAGLA